MGLGVDLINEEGPSRGIKYAIDHKHRGSKRKSYISSDFIIENKLLKSSYYDNFNSSIFGEQVKQLTEKDSFIPIKYLNMYEKMFGKQWDKSKF